MVADVILQYLGHKAVDAAAHVGQQHEYVGTIVARGQRAFDRIDLSTNPLDAGDELLFSLSISTMFSLRYKTRGQSFLSQENRNSYEHKFRIRAS